MRGVNRIRRLVRKTFPVHRIFPRCVILIYHRVYDAFSDPQLLCVSRKNFAEHLEHIQSHYHPMSLADLGKAISMGRVPRYGVAITFDDGYSDNMLNAKPILESAEIPATFFVTSGKVDDKREFWWDDLERIILLSPKLPDELKLEINGKSHSFQTKSSEDHQDTYNALHGLLRPLDNDTREHVVEELAKLSGNQLQGRKDYRPMTHEEVVKMANSKFCEIGAHTITHSILSTQSTDIQHKEIIGSKKFLEDIIDRPVTSFSYPYGNKGDFGENTIQIIQNAGYTIACANYPSLVSRKTHIYSLPRYLVRNWDGEDFARRLQRWFRG